MKKFLALVLALVMTMSLVTISAGAEDFTDNSDIAYEEAVDVMTAAGVVGGYADGSFNPTAGLTRGAAAKIICNMILGPTTAEALSADATPYSDVAVDNVFAGYIAYCAKEGIISGYADGTFRPAAPLTGYAFMKMLLGALGYDADIEGYTGANWSINVAKQALAIDLDAGLKTDFVGTKALTREEAALYAFNTMKATMVNYGNKSTIQVGDITINTSAEAQDTYNGAATETIKGDGKMQFAEKFFSKLTTTTPNADAYGRPATTWKYDTEKVGTYVNETPVAVYTEGFDTKELNALKDEDYTFTSTKIVVNGVEDTSITSVEALAAREYTGTIIELYNTDANNDDAIELIVVVQGYLAQVTFEDEDVIDLEIYNPWMTGKKTTIPFQNTTKKTEDTYDKLSAAYDKDDYLMVYFKGADLAKDYIAAADVEVVTGVVSTVKADSVFNGYVTVDGTKYTLASGYCETALTAAKEYNLFLDENGFVIGAELLSDVTAIEDVYYVAKIWQANEAKYGSTVYTVHAQLVDMTGAVSEIELETTGTGSSTAAYDSSISAGALVTISDKSVKAGTPVAEVCKANDSKYNLTAFTGGTEWDVVDADAVSEFTKDQSRAVVSSVAYRLNSATQYVMVSESGADLAANVITGGIAYTVASDNVWFIMDEASTTVLYVVVGSADEISQATGFSSDLIYIAAVEPAVGDGFVVQEVYYADGSKAPMYIDLEDKDSGISTLVADTFYSYEKNAEGYYLLKTATKTLTLADTTTNVWDEDEGVLTAATFVDLYEGLLTVNKSGAFNDIDASSAKFVDVRDTDASGQYAYTVSSLAALNTLADKEGYTTVATLSLNVSEDGAVTVFLTSLSHARSAS